MYGQKETYKIVYYLPTAQQINGARGVALIEAESKSQAMFTFQQQYAGQYYTVDTCERLLG